MCAATWAPTCWPRAAAQPMRYVRSVCCFVRAGPGSHVSPFLWHQIIGAALCVGVIDTFHSNVGGGGFMLVRSVSPGNGSGSATDASSSSAERASGRGHAAYETIDFRESLPALGNSSIYSNNSDPHASTVGGLAVGVPGELRGWELLHQRHGKLPWADLFDGAIAIAEGGFRVPSQLSVEIAAYNETLCGIPYAREVYCPTGKAAQEHEIIKKPRYARTLRTLQAHGADAFYHGEIAVNTVAAAQAAGGILTLDDLANYTAVVRDANNISFANGSFNVFASVAPSSGSVVLSALATVDAIPRPSPNANVTLHRLIEATKFAYGERSELGDPAFTSNVTDIQKLFVSPKDAQRKAALINDSSVLPLDKYNPTSYLPATREWGTSELAAIDKDGNAVTLTTTVNLIWGSRVWTSDGILLNDEMDDFSQPGQNAFGYSASPANEPAAGKRPLSSISPTIAENAATGDVFFAIGSAGGSKIITANIINGFNLLSTEGRTNIQESLAQPRWHNQLSPATTQLEWADSNPPIPGWKGFSNQTAAFLQQVGHNVTYTAPGGSTAQGIQRFHNGTLLGGAEVRQLSARAAALS